MNLLRVRSSSRAFLDVFFPNLARSRTCYAFPSRKKRIFSLCFAFYVFTQHVHAHFAINTCLMLPLPSSFLLLVFGAAHERKRKSWEIDGDDEFSDDSTKRISRPRHKLSSNSFSTPLTSRRNWISTKRHSTLASSECFPRFSALDCRSRQLRYTTGSRHKKTVSLSSSSVKRRGLEIGKRHGWRTSVEIKNLFCAIKEPKPKDEPEQTTPRDGSERERAKYANERHM